MASPEDVSFPFLSFHFSSHLKMKNSFIYFYEIESFRDYNVLRTHAHFTILIAKFPLIISHS